LLKDFQFIHYLKHDQTVTDSDVTAAYCARVSAHPRPSLSFEG